MVKSKKQLTCGMAAIGQHEKERLYTTITEMRSGDLGGKIKAYYIINWLYKQYNFSWNHIRH
ncbi:hypothetical protein DRW42_10150 [Pedobacter miscanthi]|uniref:Uncharacterized protein n=1 Tax=Pedobacter miscanthi TaxID=2259170 RepID=A0A366L290_9SPHI|nr:hypothetical protein DRW42_10150 [Pedobacter miscanthi]